MPTPYFIHSSCSIASSKKYALWTEDEWMKGLPPPFIEQFLLMEAIEKLLWMEEEGGHSWHSFQVMTCPVVLTPTTLENYCCRGMGGAEDRGVQLREQPLGTFLILCEYRPLCLFIFKNVEPFQLWLNSSAWSLALTIKVNYGILLYSSFLCISSVVECSDSWPHKSNA